MQIEATGKNVEIAIQNGLLECGLKREDVEVKVIDAGGLFKKAKVILTEKNSDEPAIIDEKIETGEASNEEKPALTTAEADSAKDAGDAENIGDKETAQEPEKKKRVFDTTRLEAKGKEFLLGLVHLLDENATVSVTAGENEISYSIAGENLSKLIGFHGDTIRALQMLLSGLKQRNEGGIRLYVDVAGYKENRNQSIIDLANRIADQAVKIERNIHLDPMNAYERRIVHTTLSERDDVITESTGEGEKRHVVVKPVYKI